MGLRAEKNILLYDKNKLIVITDLFCYYDFNTLDSFWQIKQIWLKKLKRYMISKTYNNVYQI